MSDFYNLHRGEAPLLISIPHLGTDIPSPMKHVYSEVALTVADTDWHLDRLYDFAKAMGATLLSAQLSRYVIDLNRPANDESLYPGQTTTGLCPTETFRGEAIYRRGLEPCQAERQRRVATYWQPYHTTLRAELTRLREKHPNVLLWEAHSIASNLPRLFDGKLPDLNLGTQMGRTAHALVQSAAERAAAESAYMWITNGRFQGGYITRQYGDPERGIHAVQLEMCQSTYMNEDPPFLYWDARAAAVQPTLQRMVGGALNAVECL
ncbi:MAG: N-formylglutamate deformylase [Paraburkholderia sp.]|uniref:N-formylglutamate deformylase n=1 Tax=Paraburkholderia sp. TaxID=1926495 RepID=UPI003C41168C